jgi:ABC-2 type transport system ATP-binding protein
MRGYDMIEIDGLTKRHGDKTAVDGLSFVVEPGVVTGFLGPNGAGKSTTMRVIAGLDRPTARRYAVMCALSGTFQLSALRGF